MISQKSFPLILPQMKLGAGHRLTLRSDSLSFQLSAFEIGHLYFAQYKCEPHQYKSQIMTTLRFRENGTQSWPFEIFTECAL